MIRAGGANRAGGTTHMSDETRDRAAHQVNQDRRLRILWLLPAALFLIAGPLATSAHAATTTGCSGTAVSFSDRGIPLDKVSAPGPGAPRPARSTSCGPGTSSGTDRPPR